MIKHPLALVAALVGFVGTAHAATKPSFRVEPASVSETALLVPIRIDKSAVASSYSKISVRTVDGTAKAGVDYTPISTTVTFSNSALWWSVPVAVIARPGYRGNRSFTVHIAAVRNATIAQADAAVTIIESEQPPPPPPSPTAAWMSAPLTVGGYAFVKGSIPTQACCSGLIIRIVGTNAAGTMWQGMFYSDVSGNFPANNPYWLTAQLWFDSSSIAGVAPAP